MYKISINNHLLFLKNYNSEHDLNNAKKISNSKILTLKWDETDESIKKLIEFIEKSDGKLVIVLSAENLNRLKNAFFSHYEILQAAGGVVFNKMNKLLLIKKRGKWDLPKGKIDTNETIEEAALREVEEETGLNKIKISFSLISTYHTYLLDGKRILKITFWFIMNVTESQNINLQESEGITDSKWVSESEFTNYMTNTYQNIIEVVKNAYQKN